MTTKDFITAFHGEDDTVFIRLIPDAENVKTAYNKDISFKSFNTIIPKLHAENKCGYGITFGVNGGNSVKEITKVRAHFIDIDDGSIEEQETKIKSFPLEPSVIVRTKRGFHCYWLIEDGDIERFKDIQRRLNEYFDADRNISDLSRFMRLPGFNHCKAEPFPVVCVSFKPEIKYTQDALEAHLPELKTGSTAKINNGDEKTFKKGTKEQLKKLCTECEFVKYCANNAESLSEPLWHALITNMVDFEGGVEKLHQLSKPYDGYSEEETDKKIAACISSAAGPMKCQTISDLGRDFVCSRLGKCKCTSPAGYPFIKIACPWYRETKSGYSFMPAILANGFKKCIPGVYAGESFYLYNQGYYKKREDYNIKNMIEKNLIPKYTTPRHITDTMELWKNRISMPLTETNLDEYTINLKNGLLDVRTMELHPHNKDYISTLRINAEYNPDAECPKFMEFLNSSLESELIPVVQQMIGLCCTTIMKVQKAFLLIGAAGSGKSTLIKVIQNLVGYENVSGISLQQLSETHSTAGLANKILNCCTDLPDKKLEDVGVFKQIVGGDAFEVNPKHKSTFLLKPICKLIFSANSLPQNIADRSEGFYRRLIIIRFLKSVPKDKIIRDLDETLKAEADGIFNFGIQGLKELIENNFVFDEPNAVREEIDAYRLSSNSALQFVSDCCGLAKTYECERVFLYEKYKGYCAEVNFKALSHQRFNKELIAHYGVFQINDPKNRRGKWSGIDYDRENVSPEDEAAREKILESVENTDDNLEF